MKEPGTEDRFAKEPYFNIDYSFQLYREDNPLNTKKNCCFIPLYSILPLAAMLGMNGLAYFGTRIFTTSRYHYNIESALDKMLPLVPAFVVIYILAYGQWILCYLLIAREPKEHCYRIFTGEIIAKFLCLVIFMIFPTTLNRPEITGSGIFEKMLAMVYSLDAADNLFPSIHCLESWVCWRGCRHLTGAPKWFSKLNFIFTLLVFASTVLLKQHVLIDIIGGIAVSEIGLALSGVIFKKVKKA